MKNGRYCLLMVVFGLTLVVIVARRPKFTQRLSDGTILRIHAIAYTNRHTLHTRGPIKQRFERWLPAKLDWLLGLPNLGCTISGPQETLGVWYSVFDPSTNSYVNGVDYERFALMAIVDEHGCVFSSQGRANCVVGGPKGSFIANQTSFESFPRRSSRLRLLFTGTNQTTLAEFNLDNPVKGPLPRWQAEALPITRVHDDLEIVLSLVTHHARAREGIHALIPEMAILRHGQPAHDWSVERYQWFDPCGNHGNSFCKLEPVLRLEVELFRTIEAKFDPTEVWRIEKLPPPGPAAATPLRAQWQGKGLALELLAIAGAGRYVWSNDVCVASAPSSEGERSVSSSGYSTYTLITIVRPGPHLLIKGLHWDSSEKILVRGRDDREREFTRTSSAEFSNGLQILELTVDPKAKWIDLELIPQKPVKVEFFVAQPNP